MDMIKTFSLNFTVILEAYRSKRNEIFDVWVYSQFSKDTECSSGGTVV